MFPLTVAALLQTLACSWEQALILALSDTVRCQLNKRQQPALHSSLATMQPYQPAAAITQFQLHALCCRHSHKAKTILVQRSKTRHSYTLLLRPMGTIHIQIVQLQFCTAFAVLLRCFLRSHEKCLALCRLPALGKNLHERLYQSTVNFIHSEFFDCLIGNFNSFGIADIRVELTKPAVKQFVGRSVDFVLQVGNIAADALKLTNRSAVIEQFVGLFTHIYIKRIHIVIPPLHSLKF